MSLSDIFSMLGQGKGGPGAGMKKSKPQLNKKHNSDWNQQLEDSESSIFMKVMNSKTVFPKDTNLCSKSQIIKN
jgi:hypothetical protein